MGKRTGRPRGRPSGARNKMTLDREETVKEAALWIEAQLPEPFRGDAHALLMAVYKDVSNPMNLRIDAAKAAISYEKPRLAAVEHSGDKDNPVAFAVLSGVPASVDADDDDQRPSTPSH